MRYVSRMHFTAKLLKPCCYLGCPHGVAITFFARYTLLRVCV